MINSTEPVHFLIQIHIRQHDKKSRETTNQFYKTKCLHHSVKHNPKLHNIFNNTILIIKYPEH